MIYQYIIILTLLLIFSHVFNMISVRYKVPTVIFLILTGYIIKHVTNLMGYNLNIPFSILQILGTVGLVLIVLEGTMDLKIKKEKLHIMNKALILSIFILVVSVLGIATVIFFITGTVFINAVIYAIPLSIVSSAIVIPSIGGLTEIKREFMIYEATFSDIIGILFFNFFAFGNISSPHAIPEFLFSIAVILIVSVVASAFLIFILGKTKEGTKIVMILSILLFLYSIGRMNHLSSLILIMVFGVTLNNFDEILTFFKMKEKIRGVFNTRNTLSAFRELKLINGELSFTIRTFFFLVFGFSIEMNKIFDMKILVAGTIVLTIIYLLRYVNLKLFVKTDIFPEILIAPRGLITILLFYAIPAKYQIINFDEGILFLLILSTSILMMIGLVIYKKPVDIINEDDF